MNVLTNIEVQECECLSARVTSSLCPLFFRHIGHVGWDPNTGFDVSTIVTCL